MKMISAFAFQDPNNSSQISALAIDVQMSGTGCIDFGNLYIVLSTPAASHANVYDTSDFVNASTFNNTYGANFTNYQAVAPNCSIIELNGNGNQILEQGEQFAIFLNLNSHNLNCPLQTHSQFTMGLIPSEGAKLTFSGFIPSRITPVMNLTKTLARKPTISIVV